MFSSRNVLVDADRSRSWNGSETVVGEGERSGARAALAAVDGDPIGARVRESAASRLASSLPERVLAHRRLDPDREPRGIRDPLDHVEHLVDVAERSVPGGARDVLALPDAPNTSDLRIHLGARQMSAQARLRALAQLDLDRAHGAGADNVDQPVQIEIAVLVAAAEVACADLKDEVAALAVVVRQAALAGVVPEVGDLAALLIA